MHLMRSIQNPSCMESVVLSLYWFQEKKLLHNVYKIRIDSNDTYYIDLPLELGRDTSLYRASRGHKVNHSFKPNCRCG